MFHSLFARRPRSQLIGAILLTCTLAACGPGIVESIGFGTGGKTECKIVNPASTFAAGSSVQFVAEFQPALPAGDTVKITVSRDGNDLTDLSGSVKLDKAQDCIYGGWANLAVGHYHVLVAPGADANMPPIDADFAVTP